MLQAPPNSSSSTTACTTFGPPFSPLLVTLPSETAASSFLPIKRLFSISPLPGPAAFGLAKAAASTPSPEKDCSGLLKCSGLGGLSPATLVQITLGTSHSPLHFYDVSLVDGFNLPVAISPVGASLHRGPASCDADLNACCPPALAVHEKGRVVACKSACLAAKSDEYCYTGNYADPNKCKLTVFARLFKLMCPQAYSYAYDDSTALKTCNATRYVVTFCPPIPN